MASAFTHAIASVTLGQFFPKKIHPFWFWGLGMALAILPDADVLAFKFGIPYEHPLGHRGFSHSILFAVIISGLVSAAFFRKIKGLGQGIVLWLYFFLCTVSHGILDAMTTGGRGVGFFIPWDNDRIFLPWRFIKVSPISVSQFFSEWGIAVLKSEFVFVWIPCLILIGIVVYVKKSFRNGRKESENPV